MMEHAFRSKVRTGVLAAAVFVVAVPLAALAAGKSAGHGHAGAAALSRGEYLTLTMGCNDCHTPGALFGGPDFARKLSGSDVGWRGPWGVSFAANLTSDPETGIGQWTEAELIRAFRTGVKRDGSPVLPPMPWQSLSVLTDADAHAIAAYLKHVPAVKHAVHASVPPGAAFDGSVLEMPKPPAWDAPAMPPGGH